jgi:hypothetical protein
MSLAALPHGNRFDPVFCEKRIELCPADAEILRDILRSDPFGFRHALLDCPGVGVWFILHGIG